MQVSTHPIILEQSAIVQMTQGAALKLNFTISDVTADRVDNNLVFQFEDGTVSTVVDFFVSQSAELPEFILSDGTQIASADVLSALNTDMDISTAAGGTTPSSGLSAYGDGAGDLLGGIDRLGTTEGVKYDVKSLSLEPEVTIVTATTGTGEAGTIIPIDPTEPEGTNGPFYRVVLYTNEDGNANVTVNNVFPDSEGTLHDCDVIWSPDVTTGFSGNVTFPEGWEESWVNLSFSSGGLQISLNAQGRAELARLAAEGKNLEDFLTVTITNHDTGEEFTYNVQVIATTDPDYDSHVQDTHDVTMGSEHPNYNQELLGEIHNGILKEVYTIVSSDVDDIIDITTDFTGGSQIHASGTSDPNSRADDFNIIRLKGGMSAGKNETNTITSSDGTLTVSRLVTANGDFAKNSINMGDGSLDLRSGLTANNGGENTVSGGTITAYEVAATEQGKNTVQGRDVTINSRLFADSSENTIVGENSIVVNSMTTSQNGSKISIIGGADSTVKLNGIISGDREPGTGAKDSSVDVSGSDITIASGQQAIAAKYHGLVSVNGDNVHLIASSGRTVYSSGEVIINANKHLDVTLNNATQSSAALQASGGKIYATSGGKVNLTVTNGTYDTAAITTYGTNDMVSVTAEGDITLDVSAKKIPSSVNYGAKGIDLIYGGSVDLISKNGDINMTMTGTNTNAYGISMSFWGEDSDAINLIAKNGTLNMNIEAGGGSGAYNAFGINATGKSPLNVDVKNMNMNVRLDGGSYSSWNFSPSASGVQVSEWAKVDFKVQEAMNMSVESKGTTFGIYNVNGEVDIEAGSFSMDVTNNETTDARCYAMGIQSIGSTLGNKISVDGNFNLDVNAHFNATGISGMHTITAGDTATLNVNSAEGHAFGIISGGSRSSLSADSVIMVIKGGLSATALDNSVLKANTIDLVVRSEEGESYALKNGAMITTKDAGPLHLTIDANYAMYSSGYQGNSIIGTSVAGGQGDYINLNGGIYSGTNAKNSITTGSADDVIVINGKVEGSANTLILNGGEGDDTLVLVADSISDFIERYGSWLNGLNSTNFKSIENITIYGADIDELINDGSLSSFFDYLTAHGINVGGFTDLEDLTSLPDAITLAHQSVGDMSMQEDFKVESVMMDIGDDDLILKAGFMDEKISTGAEDDSVTLNGSVNNDELFLGMEDGHLTLVQGIMTSNSLISGETGDGTLNLDDVTALNGEGLLSIGALVDAGISNFNALDLSRGDVNAFAIDGALSSLNSSGTLTVKGNTNNMLTANRADWFSSPCGSETVDGVAYDVYNSSNGNEALYVEQGILLNFV